MIRAAATLLAALAIHQGAAPPAATPPTSPSAPVFSTLSGRPPEFPAKRTEPRIWEARFEASIWAPRDRNNPQEPIQAKDLTIWMPLILQSTWSQVDVQSLRPEMWVHDTRQALGPDSTKMRQGLSQGMSALGFPFPNLSTQSLKWAVTFRAQCWNAVVDDSAAARVTWPTEWPAEAQESLGAAPGFEVGHPDFKAFVDRVSGGKLRSVTPWIAAKELVRATVNAYRAYDDDGIRIENGFPRGIVFNGARATLAAGSGTSHDCVAACVTVLRTAGIPARAVLGMTEVDSSSSGTSRTRLVSWAEFWLPQAGWIPFSPDLLRSQARGGLNVERPWKYFGSWDGLNECIPLCYGWELPVAGHRSMPFPAGFVWNSSMSPDQYARINDRIALQILGRGRAKE